MKFTMLLCLLAATGPARADFVIYHDTFSRKGNLHNTAPDQGHSRWVADGAWQADGGRAKIGSDSRSAFLPFQPHSDNFYTLSVHLHCTSAKPATEWIACGFARGLDTRGLWANVNIGEGFPLRFEILRFIQ